MQMGVGAQIYIYIYIYSLGDPTQMTTARHVVYICMFSGLGES